MLVKIVQDVDVQPMIFQGYQAKGKTKSFGYDYHFNSRKLENGLPIPDTLSTLADKVAKKLAINPKMFAEVLVTEYHRDQSLTGTATRPHSNSSPEFLYYPTANSVSVRTTKPNKVERRSLTKLFIDVHFTSWTALPEVTGSTASCPWLIHDIL